MQAPDRTGRRAKQDHRFFFCLSFCAPLPRLPFGARTAGPFDLLGMPFSSQPSSCPQNVKLRSTVPSGSQRFAR
jgi:hypothetical protein